MDIPHYYMIPDGTNLVPGIVGEIDTAYLRGQVMKWVKASKIAYTHPADLVRLLDEIDRLRALVAELNGGK